MVFLFVYDVFKYTYIHIYIYTEIRVLPHPVIVTARITIHV